MCLRVEWSLVGVDPRGTVLRKLLILEKIGILLYCPHTFDSISRASHDLGIAEPLPLGTEYAQTTLTVSRASFC